MRSYGIYLLTLFHLDVIFLKTEILVQFCSLDFHVVRACNLFCFHVDLF